MAGMVSLGEVRPGKANHGRQGWLRLGTAGCVMDWSGLAGMARFVLAG